MEERRHIWHGGAAQTPGAGRSDGGDRRGPDPAARDLAPDIFDESVFRDLAQDLGQPAARRIAEQYRAGLKRRIELLTVAALDGSGYAVHDTAADLAATSAMVGAVALARAAWAVAHDVAQTRTMPQVETLEQLMRLAHDTEAALVRRSRTDTPSPGPYG